MDWLVEVTEEFKLDQQTLYMAISIVDRSVWGNCWAGFMWYDSYLAVACQLVTYSLSPTLIAMDQNFCECVK